MALNQKIIHFQIMTSGQLPPGPSQQQRMILCTDTGKVYWQYLGQRHLAGVMPVQADWSQSDSTKLSFIKNKPELDPASAFYVVPISTDDITISQGIYTAQTSSSRVPTYIIASSSTVFPVQRDTISYSNNKVQIQLNKYLIYKGNTTAKPQNWRLQYG